MFVDPTLQVKVNDFVVVQVQVGEKISGLVRKVNEITDRQYKLSTLNPEDTEVFKNSDILGVHKIVGSRSTIE